MSDDGLAENPTEVATARGLFEHVMVPVRVNGEGPFEFIIDTGANVSCISQDLARRLALPPGRPSRVHTVAGARMRPSVMIDRLDISTRVRRSVRTPALPITGMKADGVLGVDWLKGQRLVLGFKAQTLEITKSRAESNAQGRVIVPARRRSGQLTIIDAEVRGTKISALVDSGTELTICNAPLRDLILANETRTRLPEKHRTIGMETLSGETFQGSEMHLPFLRLGGLELGDVPVVYAETKVFDLWDLTDKPAILLGLDLLTQFETVALDYGRSVMAFDIT